MPHQNEHVGVLRCQTWNVWPERMAVQDDSFRLEHSNSATIPARISVISYKQRSAPERYVQERTGSGSLVWDGEVQGLHRIRSSVLKAPEDVIEVALEHRNAYRGEVDICITFQYPGEVPEILVETLRATAHGIMSLLNLQLADFLVPSAPFQLQKTLPDNRRQSDSTVSVSVHNRNFLSHQDVSAAVGRAANAITATRYGEKLRIAMELYSAHLNEVQVRVRFLLLVMAMESLAQRTPKHQIAIDLLSRWEKELQQEIGKYDSDSDEKFGLEALGRELKFRRDGSIRAQIGKLFRDIPDLSAEEAADLRRRALVIYDKRSALVHTGHLPMRELFELETEARTLLERLVASAVEYSVPRAEGA